ncbi:Zinc knuckle CX2CX4HX4C [Trema orientale]|uniref:Zinc knuckle CX2CX4HX4C n=1 Tax=Trema orientale TaxID=63057 RepID=A0A2P5FA01_TREOI|nr:Zinc knuckle CX2CX4HX4C [Trema orientale]
MDQNDFDLDQLVLKTSNLHCSSRSLSLSADDDGAHEIAKCSTVGKLISCKTLSSNLVRSILYNIWKLEGRWTIREWGHHKYYIEFSSEEDKKWVMDRRPWNISGGHLILKNRPLDVPLEEIDLSTTEVWVQAHGLPLNMVAATENAYKIGEGFWKTLEVDDRSGKLFSGTKYLRFKVEMQATSPLFAGFFADNPRSKKASKFWVQIKYERLSDVCYKYGLLGHEHRSCIATSAATVTDLSGRTVALYGPWLKAKNTTALSCFKPSENPVRHPPFQNLPSYQTLSQINQVSTKNQRRFVCLVL